MYKSAFGDLKKILKTCKDIKKVKPLGAREQSFIATMPSGKVVFFYRTRHLQLWRGEGNSCSDAIAKGEASWGMDPDFARKLLRDKVDFVMVFCQDVGDFYVSPVADWNDKSRYIDRYIAKRDRYVRHLPLTFMRKGNVTSRLTLQQV